MKRILLMVFAAAAAAWSSAQTTYVSNLEATTHNGIYLNQERSIARAFTTGGNEAGYVLNWAEFALGVGYDSTLSVALWTSNCASPGLELVSLDAVGGNQFTPTTPLLLAANTTYWFVLESGAPFTVGVSYAWYFSNDPLATELDGWDLGTSSLWNHSGEDWEPYAANFKFAVAASTVPVPEPATWAALLGVLVLGSAFAQRRRAAATR